jgi:hypothetical protein
MRIGSVTKEWLDDLIEPHIGMFVVLTADLRILGVGATRDEARRRALEKGVYAPVVLYAGIRKEERT